MIGVRHSSVTLKLLESSAMSLVTLPHSEFKKLRREFLETTPLTCKSLLDFISSLDKKGCNTYWLRNVAKKAFVKMSAYEVDLLMEHKKRESCPYWLIQWNYSLDGDTPDDHLRFLLDRMDSSLSGLDWKLVPLSTRSELLKIARGYYKSKAAVDRIRELADAEERLSNDLRRVGKLRERVKRDASPTRK